VSSAPARAERVREAKEALASLRTLLDDATRHFPLPGGVISVVDRSGVLDEIAFGFADIERRHRMESSRRFEIGSISKLFTSLVVNRLIDDGRLHLRETVGEVLAWLDVPEGMASATVGQLLNHTSGLSVGADTLADDAAEVWHSRGCSTAPGFPPRFHYSNLGYLVLGEMVRQRSGRRLADLVQEQWLGPLGMRGAIAQVAHHDRATLATGYWPARPDQPWAPGDPLSPAPFFEIDSASGNVAATSSDMASLVQALLGASANDPVLDETGEPVLSSAVFERLTSSPAPSGEPTYLPEGMSAVLESRYARGINVERIGSNFCVSHGGGMVGYSTFLLVDCTAQFGVVVLTNANGDTLASHLLARIVHENVLRRLEGETPSLEYSLDPTVRRDDAKERGSLALGVYRSDEEGIELEVAADGESAPLRVRCGTDEGGLFHLASGRYVTNNPRLRRFHLDWFESDEGGGFTWGSETFRASTAGVPMGSLPARGEMNPLVGHYRSFSPWYPEFRILQRGRRLLLVAPGGVEAPTDEMDLVEVSPGHYRVGEDSWLPERLIAGPVRDGEVVSVNRDGCHYSRVFSD